jgi:opacity protein-like surface antigen
VKKLVLAAAALSVVSLSALADQTGIYVSGKIGEGLEYLNSNEIAGVDFGSNTKSTFVGSLAAGYNFNTLYSVPLRAELEYSVHSRAKTSDSLSDYYGDNYTKHNDVGFQTVMVNGYYDFYNSSDFTPYVSLGLGMASVNYKSALYATDYYGDTGSAYGSSTKEKFAWSVGLGVDYKVADNFHVDASYRYVGAGKVTEQMNDGYSTADSSVRVQSNDFLIGARYSF